MAAETPRPPPRAWTFGQCFGDRESEDDVSEMDMLSAVEFDPSGA